MAQISAPTGATKPMAMGKLRQFEGRTWLELFVAWPGLDFTLKELKVYAARVPGRRLLGLETKCDRRNDPPMNPHPHLLLLFAFFASIGFAADRVANRSWQEKDGNDFVYFNVQPERSASDAAKAQAEIPSVSFTSPANRWSKLPISREVLARTNSTWRVVMLGDSILNDTWRSRFGDDVQARWPGTKLDLTAVVGGGKGCWWYAQSNRVARHVVPLQPDLSIIGGISQRGDVEAIRKVIHEVRAAKHCDVLLLTGPFGSVDPLDDASWSKERNVTNAWHARLSALGQDENATFFDLQFAWGDHIRRSGKPLAWFKRDEVHANARGEAVLGYLMNATLAPAVSDTK